YRTYAALVEAKSKRHLVLQDCLHVPAMVRRVAIMDRALALALWIAVFVAAPSAMVDAVTLDPTQAAVLKDSAWGKTFDGWTDANPDCSTTAGVTCDDTGMITKLEIAYTRISGSIPSSISALRKLQLSGSIPSTIGLLTGLTTIELSYNKLTGSIPPTITSLTTLYNL
ncbi:unnamed protein product, partial [Closterium sp. NIES-54]